MAKWKSREAQLQGLPEHRSPDRAIAGNIEGRQYFRGKAFDSLDLFIHAQLCAAGTRLLCTMHIITQ